MSYAAVASSLFPAVSGDMPKEIEEYSTAQQMHESLPSETEELERREAYYMPFKSTATSSRKTCPRARSNLPPEEDELRKQIRKESNRQSAATSRKRKATQLESLEAQVKLLQAQLAAANVPVMPECDSNEGYGVLQFQQNLLQAFKPFMHNIEQLKKLKTEKEQIEVEQLKNVEQLKKLKREKEQIEVEQLKNLEQLKKLKTEKEQIEQKYLTQVSKCTLRDEQNEELQNNNEDLEKEREKLKEKVASQDSTIKQLEQKLQEMKTKTDKKHAKLLKSLMEEDGEVESLMGARVCPQTHFTLPDGVSKA